MDSSAAWRPRGCSHGHDRQRLVVALALIAVSAAQQDPITNFCRRFGHQTAVVDDRLYIDGGLVNWSPVAAYPDNYTNTWLLWQDLTHDSDDGMPQLYANLSKNSSVPDVSGGYLWADATNKYLYLFGGEYYETPPPATFVLYAYDILHDFWVSLGTPRQTAIAPVSYGAGTSVTERGEGYYYGGWLSNNSVAGWSGPPRATTGLVKYDMDTGTWSNNTGPDNVRRAEGSMVFIPAGDGGLLVYFGGVIDPHGSGEPVAQSLDTIFLYDVLSSKWYTQRASGAIPGDRRRFCAGAAWAADRSSYNIYAYGGAGIASAGYDDLYVLSLPSFAWIRLFPTDDDNGDSTSKSNITGPYPHHSLTCNVIAGAQMLIIGGSFPLTQDCDAQSQWGTHNADLTAAFGGSPALWKLFATNETAADYQVPDAIVRVIGGSPAGHATKTAPVHGWGSPDLRVLMTRTATIAARTPTRAVDDDGHHHHHNDAGAASHLSSGAIAGVAVGAAVGLALLVFGVWACLGQRRRRRQQLHTASGNAAEGHGRKSTTGVVELQYPLPLGYSDASPIVGGSGGDHVTSSPPPPLQPSSPEPVELAASSGSAYTHLTPVGSPASNTETNTGTGTGTGTGSSDTHASPSGSGPKSASSGGGGGGVWTAHVSNVQLPSRLGLPLELGVDDDNGRRGQRVHQTYYHP